MKNNRFKEFEKYFIFFLYLALFIALIAYSIKYSQKIYGNIREIGLYPILMVFLLQIFILYLCGIRLQYLLKPLNKIKIKTFNLFLIFNAASLFKYVPPKGVNYYMRIKLLDKIKRIRGKITSTFGEFISEFYLSIVCTLILTYIFLESSILLKASVLLLALAATYLMLYPKKVEKILNLFRLKLDKVRRLAFHFNKLTRRKEYYFAFLITILTAFVHGLCFYIIILSMNLPYFSLFKLTIIFYSAQFLSIILMAPAGMGVRDVSIISFLVLGGIGTGDAISISLIHRAIMFMSESGMGLISLSWIRFRGLQ